MAQPTKQALSNVQLEIIKSFSYNLSEKELLEFKEMLAQYFAQKAIKSANSAWDNQGWDNEKVNELLNTKLRKKH